MITGDKYYTSRELMYNTKIGILLKPFEYSNFLLEKEAMLSSKLPGFKTNLKSFNSECIYYYFPQELSSLVNDYLNIIEEDIDSNPGSLFTRNSDDMTLSRIYSEVEGTLNVESVPTTRKVVSELATDKRMPKNHNEQIIKNMIDGIKFVQKSPDFNENNLFTLYNILSNGCLDEDDKLLEGNLYRHDGVEVGGYNGCPHSQIKSCMDSLFEYVKSELSKRSPVLLLPHIVHYYILYIHPYFDYNGRTARMVSYWIYILTKSKALPPIVSEAINQSKGEYYNSISESRNANNDITYFLIYIFKVSIKHYLSYKNIEIIDQKMKNNSIVLTSLEKHYFKKILLANNGKFTHNDFTKWVDINMSKQGSLKILNIFCGYGLLKSEMSKSNKKLFEVNKEMVTYVVDY